jgi:hypothetical protein
MQTIFEKTGVKPPKPSATPTQRCRTGIKLTKALISRGETPNVGTIVEAINVNQKTFYDYRKKRNSYIPKQIRVFPRNRRSKNEEVQEEMNLEIEPKLEPKLEYKDNFLSSMRYREEKKELEALQKVKTIYEELMQKSAEMTETWTRHRLLAAEVVRLKAEYTKAIEVANSKEKR